MIGMSCKWLTLYPMSTQTKHLCQTPKIGIISVIVYNLAKLIKLIHLTPRKSSLTSNNKLEHCPCHNFRDSSCIGNKD